MTEPLRGALVGYGFIGGLGHAPHYANPASGVALAAIADVSPARRALAAKVFPHATLYTSAQSLLANERGLDFLDIAVPPCDHAPIARAALESGLHVLCEKPLAASLEEAGAMLRAARQAKRVLFPCHNYKHAPVVKAVRGVLDRGELGEVSGLTLTTFRNTHAKGVPEWNRDWRRDRQFSGGGIAMDHGSHTFYLTFDWLGSYPTSVTAKTFNRDPRWDVEDNVSATLTFPNGIAQCQLSWTAGTRKTLYALQGSKGGLLVDDDRLEVALQRETDGPDVAQGAVRWDTEQRSIASHWMDASHVTWFASLFDEFRKAIALGQPVPKDTLESYRCLEIIDGIYRSAKAGSREVTLSGPPTE